MSNVLNQTSTSQRVLDIDDVPDAILARWPEARDRIQTLSSDGRDIADPIGGSEDVYRQCLEQIESEIKQRVKDLDLDNLLPS